MRALTGRFIGCSLILIVGVFVLAAAAQADVPPPKPPKPFGIAKFTIHTTEAEHEVVEGASPNEIHRFVPIPYTFTQAGGHPWGLTTELEFDSEEVSVTGNPKAIGPTRNAKDVVVNLPGGLLGNPTVAPTCSLTVLLGSGEPCPPDTQVGVAELHFGGGEEWTGPIVNVTPEKGQSAEFGIENANKVTPILTAHVIHTTRGYGLTVASNGIPSTLTILGADLTFWGTPADPSHDPMRGRVCERLSTTQDCGRPGGLPSGMPLVPFLTMPADCAAGPVSATISGDAWQEPGIYRKGPDATLPAATGCDLLSFEPTIKVSPDTLAADEPVGLGVELGVPQVETPETTATPQVRDSVLTLPEGLSVSPGVVDGIQACDATGPNGIDIPTGLNEHGEPLQPGEMGAEGEELGANGEPQLAAGHCPDASIIGTAKAETPLLNEPVEGHVYLARPECGGPGEHACTNEDAVDGKLFKLYLELGGVGPLASTGVNLKVIGDTQANPATGQLTTEFRGTPQLPFSKLVVHLNGGPRAPLANPAVCGDARTTSDFTPWSAPGRTPEGLLVAGTADAAPSSFYRVEGCGSPAAFKPTFSAGTVTPQAGKFSSFTVNLARQDGEQYVKGIQIKTPPGLSGVLASVPLCAEAQADAGTCPGASQIGTTRVATGAGSHPFEIEGAVFLTGPYGGSPFGLSVVVHAVAGPFNLGLIVVRARIAVDPGNATLTVTTDETGPYAVPQIVFGVPVRLKRITVDIDRPGFMFNPTDCAGMQVSAVLAGSQQATSSASSPFAAGGCKSLAFAPKFEVSTSAHTSRTKGASLDAKLSYPKGAFGNDANIAQVKVSLPRQLPSRLTTLQEACASATFTANPANCPPASIVGIARSTTPLLPVKLEGPVYFLSHGGQGFPDLIVVLQGYGVRVDLVGHTFISKAGITSSSFETVPDVPVESFELYLPQGRFSALAANGSLCKLTKVETVKKSVTRTVGGRRVKRTIKVRKRVPASLLMATEFTGQNHAVFKQSTKIKVNGCPTTKAARTARASRNGRGQAG